MKIDSKNIQGVANAYRTGAARPKTQPGAPAAGVSSTDSVSLSSKSQEATALRNRIRQAPDVRMDLVQRIKAQVEAGTYEVAPEKVAEKLLKSKVLD